MASFTMTFFLVYLVYNTMTAYYSRFFQCKYNSGSCGQVSALCFGESWTTARYPLQGLVIGQIISTKCLVLSKKDIQIS